MLHESLLLLLITIFMAVIILLVQCAKKSSEDKKDAKGKRKGDTAKKQRKESKGSKDNTKINKMAPKGKQPPIQKSTESGKPPKNSPRSLAVFTAEDYGKDELTALLATAVKPDPETLKQLKKMKIDKMRKPLMIPPKHKGGTATVILMPPRDMQSTLLITAMPEPIPGRKKDSKEEEEFSVTMSKRMDGGEDSKKGEGGSFSLE
ncbi:hypothetical protein Mgra_00003213 [Meloidogyne graminicola]|uniref:Uncharacterized protein n=1 Tax=Meloidogyne graminicola TaxID=189291 RepID=A0A8S9ZVD0_9BILA|nr:hypothetical protein Mgra_00003213 [Meloidogyne graminicola]